jgi:hypothetical protein
MPPTLTLMTFSSVTRFGRFYHLGIFTSPQMAKNNLEKELNFDTFVNILFVDGILIQ